MKHNFKNLIAWQKSMELVEKVYILCSLITKDEKFGITSQIKRCAVSIPSNIAEGSSRKTEADFSRFLSISLGSAFELETQLILCQKLDLVEDQKASELIDQLSEIQKMIQALKTKFEN